MEDCRTNRNEITELLKGTMSSARAYNVKKMETQTTSQSFGMCVVPVKVLGANREQVGEMFGSHDWDVDSGKPFGESGLLVHYVCKRCSAEGCSVITSKGSSVSRLIETRIVNFV
jgi:hypothetical protein